MKKKYLSLILCLVMVFSLLPSFASPARATSSGVSYIVADGTYDGVWTSGSNSAEATITVQRGRIVSIEVTNGNRFNNIKAAATLVQSDLNALTGFNASQAIVSSLAAKSGSANGYDFTQDDYSRIKNAVMNAIAKNLPAIQGMHDLDVEFGAYNRNNGSGYLWSFKNNSSGRTHNDHTNIYVQNVSATVNENGEVTGLTYDTEFEHWSTRNGGARRGVLVNQITSLGESNQQTDDETNISSFVNTGFGMIDDSISQMIADHAPLNEASILEYFPVKSPDTWTVTRYNSSSAPNPRSLIYNFIYNQFASRLYAAVAALPAGDYIDPEMISLEDPDLVAKDYAVDAEDNIHIWNPAGKNQDGFKLTKELNTADDGKSFDITMKSYSTANTSKKTVVEKVPTDFVVIVDQSLSMDTEDMPTGYNPVSGTKTLEDIAAGTYFIKGDDGNYYRVYASRDYLMEYHAAETKWTQDIIEDAGYSLSWFQREDDATFSQANQYYYKTPSDGIYRPVTVTAQGKLGTYYIRFYYEDPTDPNRDPETNQVKFIRPSKPVYKNVFGSAFGKYKEGSLMYGTVNDLVTTTYPSTDAYTYSEFLGITTGMYINYPMYTRHVGYTKLSYRDVNGVEHVINPTSGSAVAEYCDSNGNAITTQGGSTRMNYNKLYTASGTTDRITALKGALGDFVKAVADESDTKNGGGNVSPVDNRIAIVGFSSDGYNNTELLTSTDSSFEISNNNGVQKSTADSDESKWYGSALVSANAEENGTKKIGTVNSQLTDAIQAISANGGTQPADGFNMAQKIIEKRTGSTYQMVSGDKSIKNRNTIVIFFTDGQPGDFKYSNQYAEANKVVEAAQNVKKTGAKVFSIGVFGESDGNPLTYADTTQSQSDRSSWKYLGGWVETYQSGGSYYCLRRQWRPNNADGYTATANDTIYDYMSVASSNYSVDSIPEGEKAYFIEPTWLGGTYQGTYTEATEGVRGTNIGSNSYYRMAANQATLVEAFKQSVTYASTQQQSTSSVSLDNTAVFRDTINTNDFDVSKATYSVIWKPIKVNDTVDEHGSMIAEWNGDDDYPLVNAVTNRQVPANGKIEYSGFNYNKNYVSSAKAKGYKLVVTVNGLVPKTYDKPIKSNADTDSLNACGIYKNGATNPEISVESPKLKVLKPATSYVVDYNLPFVIAHDLTGEEAISDKQQTNGVFTYGEPDVQTVTATGDITKAQKASPDSSDAVYTIMSFHNSPVEQAADGANLYDGSYIDLTVNSAFSSVDHAKITGKHVEDGDNAEVRTRDVYMIPASSIYMSDKTLLHPTVNIEDGHGYNAEVNDEIAKGTTPVLKELYFTFYGTGIDVYCTTDNVSGYVQAAVFHNTDTQKGAKACVKDNREGKAITVKNYSATERYNVPSISFTNLPKDTYTLKVYVAGTSEVPLYKINGVRVYSPQASGSQAETMLNGGTYEGTEYDASVDANATYLNLRKLLLNAEGAFKVNNEIPDGDVDISAITGVLYLDNADNLSTTWNDENGKPISRFEDNFDAYKHDGPKNEIYLDENQGITFQMDVSKFDENSEVYLGLSAPEDGNGTVLVNGEPLNPAVNSVMDMYYPIPINLENADNGKLSVTVTNGGKSLISITNLKITGVENLLGVSSSSSNEEVAAAGRAFFAPVTMKTVRMASNKGIDPETVSEGSETPTDTVEPAENEKPNDTENPDTNGDLVIDEPEETVTPSPEPSVSPESTSSSSSSIQKAIKNITSAISSFFKSIFRR